MMRFAMAVTLTGAAATSSLARAVTHHRGLGPDDFDPIAEFLRARSPAAGGLAGLGTVDTPISSSPLLIPSHSRIISKMSHPV